MKNSPTKKQPLIEIKNIEASIGGSRILRGVDLTIQQNQVFALMGRNGVGKTTTLQSLMGHRAISSGFIEMNGQPITNNPADQRAREGLGYVPQGRDIFPQLTVKENLMVGLSIKKRTKSEIVDALDRIYALFPVLHEMGSRKGGVLSGGQQQQLSIGRAVLTDPKVLILDEPTEGIQPSIIEHIGATLKELKREGSMSILLVEQYVDFCRDIADQFAIMDRGKVVISDDISALTDSVVAEHLEV